MSQNQNGISSRFLSQNWSQNLLYWIASLSKRPSSKAVMPRTEEGRARLEAAAEAAAMATRHRFTIQRKMQNFLNFSTIFAFVYIVMMKHISFHTCVACETLVAAFSQPQEICDSAALWALTKVLKKVLFTWHFCHLRLQFNREFWHKGATEIR